MAEKGEGMMPYCPYNKYSDPDGDLCGGFDRECLLCSSCYAPKEPADD